MSFFGGNDKAKAVVLIDIDSSSIGGAYVLSTPGAPSTVLYTTRIPIHSISADVPSALMLRTLDEVTQNLRTNGAPILRRKTGSGSVSSVVMNVAAPWQTTEIRIEVIAEDKPFTFTAGHLEKVRTAFQTLSGRTSTEESVLGTVLNGYETTDPVGKKVKRAEVMVLHASMEEEPAKLVRRALSSFSTGNAVHFSGFPSLILSAIPHAFPHEKEYLALRVSGEATELTCVKHGFPLYYSSFPIGLEEFARAAKAAGYQSFPDGGDVIDPTKNVELDVHLTDIGRRFTSSVVQRLYEYAAGNALPRTIFLLTDSEARTFIRKTLDVRDMHALWLSDEPLAIVPLECKHFTETVAYDTNVENDIFMTMLALRAQSS